jgi:hypothetical protein
MIRRYFTGSEGSQAMPARPSDKGRLWRSESFSEVFNFVARQQQNLQIIITSKLHPTAVKLPPFLDSVLNSYN